MKGDRDNKVVTYADSDGSQTITAATQTQVEKLRDAGRLVEVRRVRAWRPYHLPRH